MNASIRAVGTALIAVISEQEAKGGNTRLLEGKWKELHEPVAAYTIFNSKGPWERMKDSMWSVGTAPALMTSEQEHKGGNN